MAVFHNKVEGFCEEKEKEKKKIKRREKNPSSKQPPLTEKG